MKKKSIYYRKGKVKPDYDEDKYELIEIDDNYYALVETLQALIRRLP